MNFIVEPNIPLDRFDLMATNTKTSTYKYHTLCPHTDGSIWIRVLILEPGDWDDQISCILRPLEISKSEHVWEPASITIEGDPRTADICGYSALSYTWGDAVLSEEILVDDKLMHVTKNLESALRHIRSTDCSVVLWVDAVCINQNDIPEKNSQIIHMGTIYKTAPVVTVWLGDGDEASNMAFEFSRSFADATKIGRERNIPIDTLKSAIQPILDNPLCMDALFATFTRPWFNRVWTVQEMVLAKHFVFVCGKETLNEEELELCDSQEAKSMGLPGILDWGRYKIWKSLLEQGYGRLSVAIRLYGGRLCKDPRDKVYGLLSICDLTFPDQITVDYRFSPGQVYEMAAACFILEEGDLGSVFYGPRYYTSDLASDHEKNTVPSWVPDLSNYSNQGADPDRLDGRKYGIDVDRYLEGTGGGLVGNAIYHTFHPQNRSVLILNGVAFSQIASLGSKVDLENDNRQQTVRGWKPDYIKDRVSLHEYIRTLLLDYFDPHQRIRPDDMEDIEQLYVDWDHGEKTTVSSFTRSLLKGRVIGKVFSELENGYFAMVPEESSIGDRIAMVHGSRLPIVIRRESPERTAEIRAWKTKWDGS
ncbi:heterokaryon incompatibility protein-domain-containing protein [Xylogone sp. PMI_703]|nr:heterokaryon incompatibility protein-domain-containing protein [Xylogone sp. PMI_703]